MAGISVDSFFITISCVRCSDRMKLTTYSPEADNLEGYETGWSCDKCGFDSSVAPDAPMSKSRFYCGSGGCQTDFCILCGRKKLPVYERNVGMGEKTYPAEFQTPLLASELTACEQTVTGAGTSYVLEVTDQTGALWSLRKRYTEFEKLHMAMEGGSWSKSQPAITPFPAKEVFPNIKRRSIQLDSYLKALVENVSKLPEQYQAQLVAFCMATYYPTQSSNPKIPVQNFQMALSAKSSPVTTRKAKEHPNQGMSFNNDDQWSSRSPARETPRRPRELVCPLCPRDNPSVMVHTEYMPGEHNPSGYKSGWSCDDCKFISISEPHSQKSRYRYHCDPCQLDYCVNCADTRIQGQEEDDNVVLGSAMGSPPQHNRSLPPQHEVHSTPVTNTQSATQSLRSTMSPNVNRLREAKLLLDEGLIHQEDYDDLKRRILMDMMPANKGSGVRL
eukprot:m.260159 g.260159  ORF g.260159 m.260159 type:complete len:445 (+) comp39315_c0_seq1:239-1573(+)